MIGKTIGPYNIVSELGKGGMGVVYKAVHTTLEQQVAIKALSSELSGNPSNRQRFIKEARIQAKFSHPNVVNIFNYLEDGEDVYIVMEYVDGQTLDQKLKNEGPLSEIEAISISIPVLEALDFMHSHGVVHRDIKPSNIMITSRGLIKVTDFGIAKVVDEKTQQTKTGMVGSLYYISPEQILGEKTSAATDVYSFGVTLFHAVTGHALYEGTEYAIMTGHLHGNPAPPWEVNDKVSKNLGKVILKAIQKAPKYRYTTAKAFAQDLKKVEMGGTISFPMSRITGSNHPAIGGSGFFANKRAIYGAVGGLLLLSVIALAYNIDHQKPEPSPDTSNSAAVTDSTENQLSGMQQLQDAETSHNKAVGSTNIVNTPKLPQVNNTVEQDERYIEFDEDLYNQQKARAIEEQNKRLAEKNRLLEEKLKEEQKLYEAKVIEAKKREEERKRIEEKKLREQQRRVREDRKKSKIKNSYKKVYNPVKNNVFHPIKKGFNKLKDKID